ncbi:hypothetical protein PCASD_06894 [Puccinia coronata f. sp. avenae]|uniref:Uncharacterized protein n=1 Tax=Puccinia coronata f. sp. avenae TaxID=200324 RepID=A0A2N5UYB6_9BASI|nr:hypothetical protein PCASD_11168 [Puccinia coronata f. sp. avenae]PLW42745.1 hypothetical protein PCASD_06894 [Puccinia coronata f. sp. avenae]
MGSGARGARPPGYEASSFPMGGLKSQGALAYDHMCQICSMSDLHPKSAVSWGMAANLDRHSMGQLMDRQVSGILAAIGPCRRDARFNSSHLEVGASGILTAFGP